MDRHVLGALSKIQNGGVEAQGVDCHLLPQVDCGRGVQW